MPWPQSKKDWDENQEKWENGELGQSAEHAKVSQPEEITENDYNMIAYFHQIKGDISRWSSWGKRKHIIAKYHPELIHAFNLVESANKQLDILVEEITSQGVAILSMGKKPKTKEHCAACGARPDDWHLEDVD